MKPQLRRVGNDQSPIVAIDDFTGCAEDIASIAGDLAPFPPVPGNYYPGLRRLITQADSGANDYVEQLCREAAPAIGGAFDVDSFDLIEASFSMVTTPPAQLAQRQRAPHFDSTDPLHLALLHYLHVPQGTGTAFYRQVTTGIEVVTDDNVAAFVAAAETEVPQLGPDSGYFAGSNQFFEQIGAIEAKHDRLLIYQGSLLHSGIIPPGMKLSTKPSEGRLTANIFVRGRKGA